MLFQEQHQTADCPGPDLLRLFRMAQSDRPLWHFVRAHLRNSHILMIAVQFENDTRSVFDPTDVGKGITIIELKKDEKTPLPTASFRPSSVLASAPITRSADTCSISSRTSRQWLSPRNCGGCDYLFRVQ
jgi:hypothetical protein